MNTTNGLVLSEISQLDKYLCDHSYLVGYTPTNADVSLIQHLKENDKILRDISKYVNINRWYKHMSTYTASESKSFENTELSSLQLPGVSFGAVKKTNPVKSQSVAVKAGKDKKSCAEVRYLCNYSCFFFHSLFKRLVCGLYWFSICFVRHFKQIQCLFYS